jgi:multidrug transporter EmrE-like cation transporter
MDWYYGEDVPGERLTAAQSSMSQIEASKARQRSILLVGACTIIGALAQLFIKSGASRLPETHGVTQAVLAMAANPRLLFGYSLYGINTILLALALRDGELSMLYPIIALTYVWVAALSVVVFHEVMNPLRTAGVITIVVGVAVLGRGGRK